MIIIKNKIELDDLEVGTIQVGKFNSDWITPRGTNFLLGREVKLELRDKFTTSAPGYSAFSMVTPFRILECESLLHIEWPGYRGMNQWAESKSDIPGRLSYIDGCSNTNLIAPLRNGDPCLNYLYLPPGIEQTAHVHPSVRIGIISGGKGICKFYSDGKAETANLSEGMIFLLPRFMRHSFHTKESHLSVLVFHPDSEGGPMDQVNPMFSRTYVQNFR